MGQFHKISLISLNVFSNSSNKLPNNLKELSIALIRENYHDFEPAFAQEKLLEKHDLEFQLVLYVHGCLKLELNSKRSMKEKSLSTSISEVLYWRTNSN